MASAAIAPIACSVRVEMARPIAPSEAIAAATYSATNSSRSIRLGQRHRGPRQQRHRPDGEQGGARGQGHCRHDERDREREHHDRGVLHGEEADPPGRNRQQGAQRAVAGLAGDRVPCGHRHGQRHYEHEQQGQRDEAEEDPVPGQLADERDAVRSAAVSWLVSRGAGPTPITTGKTATTASSAWFRRRPKTSLSSERKKRSHVRTGPALRGPATAGPPAGPGPGAVGPGAVGPGAAGPGQLARPLAPARMNWPPKA